MNVARERLCGASTQTEHAVPGVNLCSGPVSKDFLFLSDIKRSFFSSPDVDSESHDVSPFNKGTRLCVFAGLLLCEKARTDWFL